MSIYRYFIEKILYKLMFVDNFIQEYIARKLKFINFIRRVIRIFFLIVKAVDSRTPRGLSDGLTP